MDQSVDCCVIGEKRRRGRPKGTMPPNAGKGRKKGVPNKSTKTCREAIARIADGMADDVVRWIRLTAEGDEKKGIRADPKAAADLYFKAVEYFAPKLSRTENLHLPVPQVMNASELTYEERQRLREMMLAVVTRRALPGGNVIDGEAV